VHFAPIDVDVSEWDCTIEPDGRVRLGLRYVSGLREPVGRAIAGTAVVPPAPPAMCPKCHCDDPSLLESVSSTAIRVRSDGLAVAQSAKAEARRAKAEGPIPAVWNCFCNLCAHDWTVPQSRARKFRDVEDMIRRTGVRRDELTVLADIGALASFGYDRRTALWQIEKAARPEGELFEAARAADATADTAPTAVDAVDGAATPERAPLPAMSPVERMTADFAGTGLTIGPHPMTFHRRALALKGVLRAADVIRYQAGRRLRVAGCVITRQRPGTAKGFVFLTLEDETGISNIIIKPDIYETERLTVVEAPFVIVEGILQHEDGVTAIRAERVVPLQGLPVAIESHDFR
jgi:DNA polymerase III alpha subunit